MPLMANAEAGENWRIRKPYSKSSLGTLLGVTKVVSLLHRYLSSHFGVDCWFVRAENLEDVVGEGSSLRWMESGAGTRCDLAPILVHVAFQVDPPGTVTLYLVANRGNVVASRSEAVRVLGNLL